MDIKRHIGRDAKTGARLVVVFMQLPDEPEYSLVVYSDSLPDRYHDNLMEVVDNADAQTNMNLYEVLSRHMFWHGGVMLTTLHGEKLLRRLPVENVLMTPTTSQQVPLRDILDQMDGGKATTETAVKESEETTIPIENTVAGLDDLQIAANLLVEAEMLIQSAEAKKQEAYKLDPSLTPKSKTRKPRKTAVKA